MCAEATARMSKALSRDSMPDIFPQAEGLLEGRTEEEETRLIEGSGFRVQGSGAEGPQKTVNTQI